MAAADKAGAREALDIAAVDGSNITSTADKAAFRGNLQMSATPFGAQYVFSCLTNNTQALKIGISDTGEHWTMLRNAAGSTDLYRPPNGKDGRDWSIIRIGDKWWVTYTVGDYGAISVPPTSGESSGGQSQVCGVASSPDLITWTHVVDIQMPNITGVENCQVWGPEFYMGRDGKPYIICPSQNATTGVNKVYVFEPTSAAMTAWTAITNIVISGVTHFIEQSIEQDPEEDVWWMYIRAQNTALSGFYRSTVGPFEGYKKWKDLVESPALGGPDPVQFDTMGLEGPNFVPLGGGHWKIWVSDAVTNRPYLFCESFDNLQTATPLALITTDADAEIPAGLTHGTIVRFAPPMGNQFQPDFRVLSRESFLRGDFRRAVPDSGSAYTSGGTANLSGLIAWLYTSTATDSYSGVILNKSGYGMGMNHHDGTLSFNSSIVWSKPLWLKLSFSGLMNDPLSRYQYFFATNYTAGPAVPTARGIGFELRRTDASNLELRPYHHDGSSIINTAGVAVPNDKANSVALYCPGDGSWHLYINGDSKPALSGTGIPTTTTNTGIVWALQIINNGSALQEQMYASDMVIGWGE